MTGEVLWYLNRATGIVTLVLMTVTVVLGTVVRRHGRVPGLPRFAVTGLHRNVGLLTALLLVTHVLTAVVDSYVDIGTADVLVPFTAGYRPLAIGLGTLAADLLLLVVVTSLLRERLPQRVWKAVHLTTYVLWPLAFVHGLTAGTDLGGGWLLAVVLACAVATTWASAAALRARRTTPPPFERAAAALASTSAALSTGRPVGVFRNG
ncbi:ferric reductase-like transmembrane domain-containing protein [Blastococcus sp. CT_GayMR16]|uniref:ferric reductase-like transmembrane domain-containing protein n=1 Tax=Blastococcus sp. CT_GayMR16 TaxID=2559607 RepID=UPI00107368D8|nr:ferric reductase-like transmembrane domain-containing protein [Blastococcus sp. CT_GayMR16]TFV89584.1 ferric reductase [Blastococcus sp. CT_GayMR16]